MANIKTTDYILPAHWAPVLINSDYTGCNDDEGKLIDEFLLGEFGEGDFDNVVLTDDGESEFVKYHDAHSYGVLACDCLRYTFIC